MRQPNSTSFSMLVRRGFTIIEMLVVMVIMMGLIALLIPHLGAVKRNAVITAARVHLGAIQAGLQTYYAEMNNVYPASGAPPGGAYGGAIPVGRGSALLAEGLMGYLPGGLDGAGPPFPGDPVFGFRTRQSAMGGRIYGPYMSSDPKGYNRFSPGVNEFFVDPWGNEILYYRSARPVADPAAPQIKRIFDVVALNGTTDSYFVKDDCSVRFDGSAQADPTAASLAFFKLIYPKVGSTANTFTFGQVTGSDSYLLISAGPNGVYFTADDIALGKP